MYPINEKLVRSLVREELTKTEVKAMIDDKIDELLKKRDFEKKVKEYTGDVLINLWRYLYNQRGFVKGGVS
ncbi:MAG: hypothetical protein LUD72_07480 [Bacteroidales bacterium]|nr:hypothetical protein [Bacteroidales bacterium]